MAAQTRWSSCFAAVLAVVALAVTPRVSDAQYVRPTTIILPGKFDPTMAKGLETVLATRDWEGAPTARSYFEGAVALAPELQVRGGSADKSLAGSADLNRAGRALIGAHFMLGPDFVWRNDTLQARARYSLSYQQASREARRVGGPNPAILKVLTSNYVFAISADTGKQGYDLSSKTDTVKPAPDAKDQSIKIRLVYTVKTKWRVAVFRMGYDTPTDVAAALDAFYCDDQCADRAQRQAAFQDYTVPMQYVVGYGISGEASAESEDDAARRAARDALKALYPKAIEKLDVLKVSTVLIGRAPPAARIGMKEGLGYSDRYFVYLESEKDGQRLERRGAVLMARKVADNRGSSFVSSATTVQAARPDSTVFKRVYPGKLEPGFLIREAPATISAYAGPARYDATNAGLQVIARTEMLGTQVGLSGQFFPRMAEYNDPEYPGVGNPFYSKTFLNLEIGQEFYPLAGRFRVMPVVGGGLHLFGDGILENNEGYEEEAGDKAKLDKNPLEDPRFSALVGLDGGIRLSPFVELTVSWRAGRVRGDTPDASGRPSGVTSFGYSTMSYGIRLTN